MEKYRIAGRLCSSEGYVFLWITNLSKIAHQLDPEMTDLMTAAN